MILINTFLTKDGQIAHQFEDNNNTFTIFGKDQTGKLRISSSKPQILPEDYASLLYEYGKVLKGSIGDPQC